MVEFDNNTENIIDEIDPIDPVVTLNTNIKGAKAISSLVNSALKKIISPIFSGLQTFGIEASLFYLFYSLLLYYFYPKNDTSNDDDSHDPVFIFIFASLLISTIGSAIYYLIHKSTNDIYLERSESADAIHDELDQEELQGIKEDYNPIEPSLLKQSIYFTLLPTIELFDFWSAGMASVDLANGLLETEISPIAGLLPASVLFMLFSPSTLQSLSVVSPRLVNNPATRLLARHPKPVKNITVLAESTYDMISSLLAIPPSLILIGLELSPLLTIALAASLILLGSLSILIENFLFDGKNLENVLNNINHGDYQSIDDSDEKVHVNHWQKSLYTKALYGSLVIQAMANARSFSNILTLFRSPLWLHYSAVSTLLFLFSYGQYKLITKNALKLLTLKEASLPASNTSEIIDNIVPFYANNQPTPNTNNNSVATVIPPPSK